MWLGGRLLWLLLLLGSLRRGWAGGSVFLLGGFLGSFLGRALGLASCIRLCEVAESRHIILRQSHSSQTNATSVQRTPDVNTQEAGQCCNCNTARTLPFHWLGLIMSVQCTPAGSCCTIKSLILREFEALPMYWQNRCRSTSESCKASAVRVHALGKPAIHELLHN